jgi:hypothetical protein
LSTPQHPEFQGSHPGIKLYTLYRAGVKIVL